MTGLLIASPAGSGKGLGRNQSATNSNASSEVPTQVMNRTIGITISLAAIHVTRANAAIPDRSLWNVVTARIPVGKL
jgi:hypothetical protein